MIEGMPYQTLKERRNRAMVAIAFLAALRADTVTSLRVKHLERAAQIVVQDAKSSRTKNGKSLRIKFFPLPVIFAQIVCDWKDELLCLGFSGEDALFPGERFLVRRGHPGQVQIISPMTSTHAISKAFEVASKPLGERISPHAAKHCIGSLSLLVCKTPEELKAWSMNMGHENEEVTLRYYKHLPVERVVEIFEQFDEVGENGDAVGGDEKDLMLLYHEHKLDRGSPEFERAQRLVRERLLGVAHSQTFVR